MTGQSDNIYLKEAAERFAEHMGIELTYTQQNAFTILASADAGDDVWFDSETFNITDFEDFVRLVIAYGNEESYSDLTKVTIHLDCPRCHSALFTPKQVQLNKIGKDFVVCNKCAEVMKIDEQFNMET